MKLVPSSMKRLGLLGLAVCLSCAQPSKPMGATRTGIDVLAQANFAPLSGKRVGLITNHTGINREWRSTIDILFEASNVDLVALFNPEHGIRGVYDDMVASGLDSTTGLPIHSLYGKTIRPTPEMLIGIDVLVFDIQDIGARFYTYIGTMKKCMEEAAKLGIEFIVLDRPNPITGVYVEGPVMARERVSRLVNSHSIPLRHGMTVGELAEMFRADDTLNIDLSIVKMEGWRRDMWFDQTGLPWINPSPNIRNLYQATLYPGLGLLERTNVSNKRGLERPFEMFGAPWVNGSQLTQELNSRQIPGVQFSPIRFTPAMTTYPKYAEQVCEGVAVNITDRDCLPSVELGLHVLQALYKLYPEHFEIEKIWHVTRSEKLIEQLKEGTPINKIVADYGVDLEDFLRNREKYLFYD